MALVPGAFALTVSASLPSLPTVTAVASTPNLGSSAAASVLALGAVAAGMRPWKKRKLYENPDEAGDLWDTIQTYVDSKVKESITEFLESKADLGGFHTREQTNQGVVSQVEAASFLGRHEMGRNLPSEVVGNVNMERDADLKDIEDRIRAIEAALSKAGTTQFNNAESNREDEANDCRDASNTIISSEDTKLASMHKLDTQQLDVGEHNALVFKGVRNSGVGSRPRACELWFNVNGGDYIIQAQVKRQKSRPSPTSTRQIQAA